MAERFILTLKSELIWTRDWESADELDIKSDVGLEVAFAESAGWDTHVQRRGRSRSARSPVARVEEYWMRPLDTQLRTALIFSNCRTIPS